jgi:uncharacterized protein
MEAIMEKTNLKLVQDAYGAFGRGDVHAVLEEFAPDAVMGIVGRPEDCPLFGMHHGKTGAGEFFRLLNECQDISLFEPQRFIAAEDKVFVWGRYAWTMRKSGVSKTSEWLHVFTLRGGKVTAWLGHNDTAMLAEAYHAAPALKRALNR